MDIWKFSTAFYIVTHYSLFLLLFFFLAIVATKKKKIKYIKFVDILDFSCSTFHNVMTQSVLKICQQTSFVNLHCNVAHPNCIIPLEPSRISYIHFPFKKEKHYYDGKKNKNMLSRSKEMFP